VLRETPPSRPTTDGGYDEKKMDVRESHSEAHAGSDDDKETRVAAAGGAADRSEAASQSGVSLSTVPLRHAVTSGRPDARELIRTAVSETAPHQRVLVAACGPDSLMRVVRNTTAECIRADGPGVELHCEQFGW
jgi:hypothetical protein